MQNNPFDLSGNVALVTGAGGGIGFAVAETLANAGARVGIADANIERAQQGSDAISAMGGQSLAIDVDVTDPASVDTMVERTVSEYGRLDIQVNAAGIASNTAAEDMTTDEWHRVIDVNLNGVFWCCRAAGRAMLERDGGSIINIASMNACVANNPQPQVHYNASKSGVIMLTRSLAVEWAKRGVRVNAVSPGYIRTDMTRRGLENDAWRTTWLDMTPMGRTGEPVEVANTVWFLASAAASFATGSNFIVDGGYTAW